MALQDMLYDKVCGKIDSSKVSDDTRQLLKNVLDRAYMKAMPTQYLKKNFGDGY